MNVSPASDPAVRRSGIGGSDIAAIVGVDPWGRTAYDKWLEIRGEAPPREEMGENMLWGQVLEEPVAQESARRLELKIARVNRTLVHRDHPFMTGHLDRRVIGERAALEVKTTSLWMAGNWASESPENIPVHIQYQIQHYMEIGELDRIYVCVLIGGQTLKIFTVERDRSMGADMVEVCAHFWHEHVVKGIAPPPTTRDEVLRRFPRHIDYPVAADTATAQAFDALVDAKARIKAAKAEEEAAADAIAAFLCDRDALTINGATALTFRTQLSNRFDVKAFELAHPALYAEFLKESSGLQEFEWAG